MKEFIPEIKYFDGITTSDYDEYCKKFSDPSVKKMELKSRNITL